MQQLGCPSGRQSSYFCSRHSGGFLSDPGEGFTFNIKGVAKTGAEARDLLLQNNPDLLLLDLSLPDMGGLQLLPSLKRDHANTRILVMATTEVQNLAQAVLKPAPMVLC